jgi:hypothetical protein
VRFLGFDSFFVTHLQKHLERERAFLAQPLNVAGVKSAPPFKPRNSPRNISISGSYRIMARYPSISIVFIKSLECNEG